MVEREINKQPIPIEWEDPKTVAGEANVLAEKGIDAQVVFEEPRTFSTQNINFPFVNGVEQKIRTNSSTTEISAKSVDPDKAVEAFTQMRKALGK